MDVQEGLALTDAIEFREVAVDRWGDLERLSESRDGPKYCWCMVWRAMPPGASRADCGAKKEALRRRVQESAPVGILGYIDGEAVAWRQSRRARAIESSAAPADAPGSVWSIVCFFVPRRLRGHGMTKRLIGAAVDHARERGAAVVEAYPVDYGSPSYRFMGYVGSFEAMGFRAIGRTGTRRHPHLNPPPRGEEARQGSNRQMEKPMTSQQEETRRQGNGHDDPERWRERAFIDSWVKEDDERPNDRLEPMREALAATPYPKDEPLLALDIGAGHGMFAGEVLRAFPKATVTLQDVSEPMFDIARERLAERLEQLRFVQGDLTKREWMSGIGGPFDLAVSSIAIHNLYNDGLTAQVYKDIFDLLKPGGTFINLDHIRRVGGVEGQTAWLRDAGFAEVDCVEVTTRIARLQARKAS